MTLIIIIGNNRQDNKNKYIRNSGCQEDIFLKSQYRNQITLMKTKTSIQMHLFSLESS